MQKIFTLIYLLLIPTIILGENKFQFESGLGINLNKGNTDKISERFYLNIIRYTDKLKLLLNLNQIYGESKGIKDTNKGDMTLKCDYDITKQEQPFIFFISYYNQFQDIKLRTQTGIGNKHTFYKSEKVDYSISGAILYETMEYLQNKDKGYLGRLSIRPKIIYNFENFKAKILFFYQPQVNYINDYRMILDINLEFKIIKHLFFEFKIFDEYNNIVPENIKRNDLTSYNGIKFKI